MKHALIIAGAIMLTGAATWASNARLNALGNGVHICDAQTVLKNPANIYCSGDQMSLQYGETAGTTAAFANAIPNSEGLLIRSLESGKVAVVLGRHNANINGIRAQINAMNLGAGVLTTPLLPTENSLAVVYGTKTDENTWGLGLYLSSSDMKTTEQKQNAQVLSFGYDTAVWYFNAGLPINYDSSVTDAGYGKVELNGIPGMSLGAGYKMGSSQAFITVDGGGGKLKVAGTEAMEMSQQIVTVGYNNPFFSKEGTTAYYQIAYQMDDTTIKTPAGSSKINGVNMPFVMGLETDAATWLVLRGSISQNVLLGSLKDGTAATPKTDSVAHNTTVNAGAGFKWDRSLLDITLNAASTGTLGADGAAFGGQAAYTYSF